MHNLFFELIRFSIETQSSLSRMPSAKEWELLYAMAQKQSLIGICFAGVKKLCNFEKEYYAGMNEMLYLTWMGMAAKIQQRNETVNQQCAELQAKLSADGLKACVLKGQGVASLYSEHLLGLRQSGDIDLWVDAPMDVVVDYVFKHAPSKVFDLKHIHYDVFEDTEVELHWIPGVSGVPSKNARLKRYYESHKCVFENRVSLPSGDVITAADARMNAVYLLQHIQGHYLYEGIGMRQLMDYYFTLRNLGVDDRTLAKKEIAEMVLQKILSAVMYVMVVVFGLDEEHRLCEPDKELGEELLDEIMNGGNFGHYNSENNVKNESRAHWAWRRLKRRFKLIRYDSASMLFRPIYRMRVALVKNRIGRKYHV